MKYKGYEIAAYERVYNLVRVDEDGTISDEVLVADWDGREYSFFVVDSAYQSIGGIHYTIEEAKRYIDRLEAQQ